MGDAESTVKRFYVQRTDLFALFFCLPIGLAFRRPLINCPGSGFAQETTS
jgi:hypothetical protein